MLNLKMKLEIMWFMYAYVFIIRLIDVLISVCIYLSCTKFYRLTLQLLTLVSCLYGLCLVQVNFSRLAW